MAADHGVTEEAVSKYPQEVTAQMMVNFVNQDAGINALAKVSGARVRVLTEVRTFEQTNVSEANA